MVAAITCLLGSLEGADDVCHDKLKRPYTAFALSFLMNTFRDLTAIHPLLVKPGCSVLDFLI